MLVLKAANSIGFLRRLVHAMGMPSRLLHRSSSDVRRTDRFDIDHVLEEMSGKYFASRINQSSRL